MPVGVAEGVAVPVGVSVGGRFSVVVPVGEGVALPHDSKVPDRITVSPFDLDGRAVRNREIRIKETVRIPVFAQPYLANDIAVH